MDLKKALKEYNEAAAAKRPQEIIDIMTNSAEQLVKDKIGKNALAVGDKIPNFTLGNANGEEINIYDCLAEGPMVISFYRGAWCPYCNLELKAYKDILPQIKELGANLVAISPELPDNSFSLIEKHELGFEILSDLENVVAKKFGLVFKLDEAIIEVYKKFGIDVEAGQGNDKYEVPLPATYVIDGKGEIVMAYVNTDYTKRLEPSETLTALSAIQNK
ncbi:peroxiredoxin-like family protein [Clostridium grantii]|uniref:thioredoxin-dependent peroxiredoxin n=1 Tax=Clostridium grantii DSM 8605 TaxID=1121316 RepID=A0A1M5WP26_9CLOT|nr:peroxiredoxin-like family protein [Clostridium grantii]SHH89267.1 Peroxiredoxin [Clostridium grantii DSM 8605]